MCSVSLVVGREEGNHSVPLMPPTRWQRPRQLDLPNDTQAGAGDKPGGGNRNARIQSPCRRFPGDTSGARRTVRNNPDSEGAAMNAASPAPRPRTFEMAAKITITRSEEHTS